MKILVTLMVPPVFFSAVSFGWAVIDTANLAQNTLSVLRQIEQIEQTGARIKYEVKAAERLIKRLKSVDITKIRDLVGLINSFRSRTRAIGYTYENIENQFERIYGKTGSFKKNFQGWQKQSDESVKDAMVSQGLIEKSQKHMVDLDEVIKVKNESQGDSDTLHAIGEINAIQSKQLADLSQIVATDAHAKNSVIMEQRAKEQELKNYEAHLMKDFNDHGKSRPLTHFPSLGSTTSRR